MSEARKILKSENEMLKNLIAQIEEFAKDYSGFEAANLRCWGEELSGYRETNNKYLNMNDQDLKDALTEELTVLEECHITRTSDVAEYWKKFLKENIYYTQGTRDRI